MSTGSGLMLLSLLSHDDALHPITSISKVEIKNECFIAAILGVF